MDKTVLRKYNLDSMANGQTGQTEIQLSWDKATETSPESTLVRQQNENGVIQTSASGVLHRP